MNKLKELGALFGLVVLVMALIAQDWYLSGFVAAMEVSLFDKWWNHSTLIALPAALGFGVLGILNMVHLPSIVTEGPAFVKDGWPLIVSIIVIVTMFKTLVTVQPKRPVSRG